MTHICQMHTHAYVPDLGSDLLSNTEVFNTCKEKFRTPSNINIEHFEHECYMFDERKRLFLLGLTQTHRNLLAIGRNAASMALF